MEIITPKSDMIQGIPKEKRDNFYRMLDEYIYKQNNVFHEKTMNSMCICSLSERIDLAPMWAHYANNHKGFAIEFDFINECPQHCQNTLFPVLYSDDVPDLSTYFLPTNEGNFNNLVASYQSMIKNKDWSYEKEWRVIIPLGDGSESGINIKGPKIKAIYSGINISKKDKEWLNQICKDCNLEMFQMIQPNRSFLLLKKLCR